MAAYEFRYARGSAYLHLGGYNKCKRASLQA